MPAQPASAARLRDGGQRREPPGEGGPGDGSMIGCGTFHPSEVHRPVAVCGLVGMHIEAMGGKAADARDHREGRDECDQTVTAERPTHMRSLPEGTDEHIRWQLPGEVRNLPRSSPAGICFPLSLQRFPHSTLTPGRVASPLHRRFAEGRHGLRFHSHHRGAVCRDAFSRVGDLAPRRLRVSTMYAVSGLLALGLCVYLLYAMLKPEKF